MDKELVVAGPTVNDIMAMAEIVYRSGLFPQYKTRESAAALMLLCRAKNLDPMTAVERYHVVQGRPVMRADAMLGEFIRLGGSVTWNQRDEKAADATFAHPQGGTVQVRWTIEMARAAKLTGKEIWNQYPRQMLHARCVSEGVRSVLPGATNGLYTPEEAMQMEPIVAHVVEPEVVEQEPAALSARRGRPKKEPVVVEPVVVEPEPVRVEAKPAPAFPEKALEAIFEFARVAAEHGIDVLADNGKLSKTKLMSEALRLWEPNGDDNDQDEFDPTEPEHWYGLVARVRWTTEPEDIRDPFSED